MIKLEMNNMQIYYFLLKVTITEHVFYAILTEQETASESILYGKKLYDMQKICTFAVGK